MKTPKEIHEIAIREDAESSKNLEKAIDDALYSMRHQEPKEFTIGGNYRANIVNSVLQRYEDNGWETTFKMTSNRNESGVTFTFTDPNRKPTHLS